MARHGIHTSEAVACQLVCHGPVTCGLADSASLSLPVQGPRCRPCGGLRARLLDSGEDVEAVAQESPCPHLHTAFFTLLSALLLPPLEYTALGVDARSPSDLTQLSE